MKILIYDGFIGRIWLRSIRIYTIIISDPLLPPLLKIFPKYLDISSFTKKVRDFKIWRKKCGFILAKKNRWREIFLNLWIIKKIFFIKCMLWENIYDRPPLLFWKGLAAPVSGVGARSPCSNSFGLFSQGLAGGSREVLFYFYFLYL